MLGLNNNYWSSQSNPAIVDISGPAYAIGEEMFHWVLQHTKDAHIRGDKVTVLAHITPYSDPSGPMWSEGRYRRFTPYRRFSALEPYYLDGMGLTHFFGHMHNDEWMIARSCAEEGAGDSQECIGQPLGLMVTVPGISYAYPAANPAIRLLHFNDQDLGLMDMTTWTADLHRSNDIGDMSWSLEYKLSEAFGMIAMTPSLMPDLVERMALPWALPNSKEWEKYRGNMIGTYWCKAWMGDRGKRADSECAQGCHGECKRNWLNVLNGSNTTGIMIGEIIL